MRGSRKEGFRALLQNSYFSKLHCRITKICLGPLENSNNRRTPPNPTLRKKSSGSVHEQDLVEKVSIGYRFDLQTLLILC